MPDVKQRVELWKTVTAVGSGLMVAGIPLLAASGAAANRGHLEVYGLALLIGGFVLVLLALASAYRQQEEWRRPPRLARGLNCTHFPMRYEPSESSGHPHSQELVIGIRTRVYPPDFRIICSAPIRRIEARVESIPAMVCFRFPTKSHSSIDGTSLHFSPLEPIDPPSTLFLTVFSDEPIRVRAVKRLRTRYPTMPKPPELTAAKEKSLPAPPL